MLRGYWKIFDWELLRYETLIYNYLQRGTLQLNVAQILEIKPVTSLGINDCLSSCVLRRRCRELTKMLRTRSEIMSVIPYLNCDKPPAQVIRLSSFLVKFSALLSVTQQWPLHGRAVLSRHPCLALSKDVLRRGNPLAGTRPHSEDLNHSDLR